MPDPGRNARRNTEPLALHPVVTLLAIGWLVTLPGCLQSSARYVRPSGAVIGPGVYKVPRNWDYRRDYALPLDRFSRIVQSYIGVPYRYGGNTRRGLDCSGFVAGVFKELNKARMPRTTRRQKALGREIGISAARPGDLVFFALGSRGVVDHVGVCVGGGKFAHASVSRGVTYDRLSDPYFSTRVVSVKRIF